MHSCFFFFKLSRKTTSDNHNNKTKKPTFQNQGQPNWIETIFYVLEQQILLFFQEKEETCQKVTNHGNLILSLYIYLTLEKIYTDNWSRRTDLILPSHSYCIYLLIITFWNKTILNFLLTIIAGVPKSKVRAKYLHWPLLIRALMGCYLGWIFSTFMPKSTQYQNCSPNEKNWGGIEH